MNNSEHLVGGYLIYLAVNFLECFLKNNRTQLFKININIYFRFVISLDRVVTSLTDGKTFKDLSRGWERIHVCARKRTTMGTAMRYRTRESALINYRDKVKGSILREVVWLPSQLQCNALGAWDRLLIAGTANSCLIHCLNTFMFQVTHALPSLGQTRVCKFELARTGIFSIQLRRLEMSWRHLDALMHRSGRLRVALRLGYVRAI